MKKIIAMLLALMLIGACALAEGTLTVEGAGVVSVDADRATINMGVQEQAKDVTTAQARVNEKIDAVLAALREAGVEDGDIATNGIGVYSNWNDYDENGEPIISGYTAYNNLSVTVNDPDQVGTYVDTAFAAGANSLDYVEFYAADIGEASDQALMLAVQAATKKARVLANAAGVELGAIVEIRDNASSSYVSNDTYAERAEADSGAGTQVLPGRQQVTAVVSITFAIAGE